MATTYHTAIQKLYVAYFNRPADFAGLNYWETVVEAAAGDTTAVSAAFAGSAEYAAEYGGMSNADVINQIYINLFGRPAEPSGIAYWANAVTNGDVTMSAAVTAIAAGAQGTDKVAYDSKVLVATAFTNALNTPAEQTGYSGDLANEAAKVFLATIKTAAQATAAVVPATLDASVLAVVEASAPFTLANGLATLAAAQDAKAAFLVTADGDDDEDTSALEGDIAVDAAAAEVAIDVFVPGYSGASTAVAAAMLADEVALRADTLVTAQGAYEDALEDAADVDGLTDAIASAESAAEAVDTANDEVLDAAAAAAAAMASYNVKNSVNLTIAADGTVVGVIELDDGELVLMSGVDEDDNPGVTALLAASTAKEEADASYEAAVTAQYYADLAVDILDIDAGTAQLAAIGAAMTVVDPDDAAEPTASEIQTEVEALTALAVAARAIADDTGLPADDATADAAEQDVIDFQATIDAFIAADADPLSGVVAVAAAAVSAAEDDVEDLDDAIADLADANVAVLELDALNDDIAAVEDDFDDAGLNVPVNLTAVVGATSGSDIYIAGDVATSTVVNFGQLGDDSLFIGTDYTLNTGALSTGNNSVLEVFMIQSGTSVKIYLETEVYGTDTAAVAEQVITLTGITVAELSLSNGIITAA
jgi:hypothetical protein